MSVRKKYSASFKAKVALAALTNDKTMAELCSEFGPFLLRSISQCGLTAGVFTALAAATF